MYRSAGRYHDLASLYASLNSRYFQDMCLSMITWGQASVGKRRRSIQLGCYMPEARTIRIHPCLDQHFVPSYFVSGVVFHEMLHEIYGADCRAGKRRVHTKEFKILEEMYEHHKDCQEWEKQNVHLLLRY